jgi:hypothetical protein
LGASAWFIKENIPSTQPASVPTPSPSTAVFDVLKDFKDKVKDFPHKVLNTGIKWGDTTTSTNPWEELKYRLGNGGDANPAQQSAVRATFEEIARGYNAQRPGLNLNADEMLYAYRKGREAAAADVPSRINGAFSELEKHISLKEANAAVPHANPIAHLGQHLQHFAKTAHQAVGATMHHASDAVGHAWNSEPVQGTLHLVKENSHYLTAGSAAVMLITPAVRAALAKQEKNSSPVPAATIQAKFQNALRVTKAVLATKISVQDCAKQFNNPQTILAGVRTAGFALAAVSPAAAVVATATTAAGVSSLAARVVHAATKDRKGFEQLAAASKYMGDMEYINAATKSVQQTMASVQHTMAGLFGRITQQFKTA